MKKNSVLVLSTLLFSVTMTNAYANKEEVILKVGESKFVKYVGKVHISCTNNGESAGTRIGYSNVVSRGGALDAQDKAFMIAGEFYKSFSPLPTQITATCLADSDARYRMVHNQQVQNHEQDYQDFRELTNEYWECGPKGLLASTEQATYRAKSCHRDQAIKASQFNCYEKDRFGMHGCDAPIQCYVVKMSTDLMCDFIIPDRDGIYRPH